MKAKYAAIMLLLTVGAVACSSSSDKADDDKDHSFSDCAQSPGDLPRAPKKVLPCELIPPGMEL